ncbi:MAG TPA: DNA-3-methyladenine glycosylase 2 family protein [Acidobacteriaceae bacterium]|nr:DNA-3-methyladenine glycosylase 2 family protein [Acidobacteriaceae bacterium]
MPRAVATPRPPRYDYALACKELALADPKLGKLIARAGPFTLRLASTQSPFEALVQSIIYQQLHGKAAATIHRRLIESFAAPTNPGAPFVTASSSRVGSDPADAILAAAHLNPHHPTPQQLLDCPNEQLRAAGLSHNKTLALRDLAAKTIDGTVPTLARIRRMSDAEIIDHLTQVRGIGIWTVHMMLMFRLGRPDVLPTGDYGVRKGFALTFGKLKPPSQGGPTRLTPADLATPAELEHRAKRWHPWRSVASWYLWRACDLAAAKP